MSSNPEKPPIEGQEPQQHQHQNQQPYFPPPPSGPQDQPLYAPQTPTSQHPPTYSSGGQAYTGGDQKPPISPQIEQQYYPPPPPGPPPSQQQYQPNADAGSVHATYKPYDYGGPPPPLPGPRPTQQQQQGPNPVGYGDTLAPTQATQVRPRRSWGDRLSQMGSKAAAPINAIANKLGSQSFLPTTMDKECEKAASIIRSFCKEGITSDNAPQGPQGSGPTAPEPTTPGGRPVSPNKQPRAPHGQRAIVKIPSKVIQRAQGLAIFTTARVSYGFSGATGSGILIARRPDGSWSPPSGIQVHTLGAGFSIGVDIYDCICVINSREALEAFKSTRVSLGPDVAVTAGPYGAGGNVQIGYGGRKSGEHRRDRDDDLVYDRPPSQHGEGAAPSSSHGDSLKPPRKDRHRRSSSGSFKPVFTYVKSRGFYAGVQVDGTVITERRDANAAFYGQRVGVEQILRGEVPPSQGGDKWPAGSSALYEALRVAESQQPLPDANLPPPPPPAASEGVVPPSPSASAATGGQLASGYPSQSIHPAWQGPGGQPPHGQPPHMSGGAAHPPGSSAQGDELPGYVDDGVQRPGVGDVKYHYQ